MYTITGGTVMVMAIFIVTLSKYLDNRNAASVSRLTQT